MVSEFLRICRLWFRNFCVIYERMKEEKKCGCARIADGVQDPERWQKSLTLTVERATNCPEGMRFDWMAGRQIPMICFR